MTSTTSGDRRFKRTLLVALAAMVLALLAGGYVYYRSEAGRIQKEKFDGLQAIGALKAGQVERWRSECLADARRTVRSPFFVSATAELVRRPYDQRLRAQMRERLTLERHEESFAEALLLDPKGNVLLATSDDPDPVGEVTRQAVAASLAGRDAVFSDLYRSPRGVVHLDVVAPVMGGEGRPLAVVVLRSDAGAFLFPLIQSWPMSSQSAETLLIRRSGDEVVYLNELRHRADTALSLRVPLSHTDVPAVQAGLGKRGLVWGRDYRGVEVLADVRPVAGSDWFLVAKVDAVEILAEARYRAGMIALFAALGILLAGAVVVVVYRQRQAGLFRSLYESERKGREVEEESRTTLYSIGDAVITTDRQGRVKQMNPVAETLTGWPEAEARGQPLGEVFHILNEETRAVVESPAERVVREGRVVGLGNHTVLVARDGTERPIADSGAPIQDESGAVTGVVLVFRDQSAERAAQKALKESEETFRALAENANDGILVAGDEGVHVFANRRAAEITGYSVDELAKVSVKDLAHPDEFEKRVRDRYERVLAGKPVPGPYETVIVRKDRENVPVEVTSAKTSWHGRTADLVILRDISERKRAEEALRTSEARFSTIFHASPIGLSTTRLADGQYVDVNEAFLGLFGYTREEALSHTSIQLQTWASPDERDRVVRALREQGKIRDMEAQYRRKSGEIWTALISAELIEVAGERYSLSLLQDISEKKRVEQALRESEELNRTTLYSIGDAVITTDRQGRVKQMNPVAETLTGWPEAEAQGKLLGEVFHILNEETRAVVESPAERVVREGQVVGLGNHTVLIARDGTERPIADSGAPIRDESGAVSGVVLVFRDQTQEQAAQRRYQELFDNVAVGLLRSTPGPEGTFIDVNPAMVEMFEADSREQLMAVHPSDIYLDQDQRRIVSDVIAATGRIDAEVKFKTLKGKPIWCRITGVKKTAANGQICFDNTMQDITERKQAEEALRESERKFRQTVENLDEGYYACTADGTVLEHNLAFNRILGLDAARDMRGAKLPDFWQNPDDRQEYLNELMSRGSIKNYLISAKTVGGDKVVVMANAHLVKDDQGRLMRIVGTFTDFTERRRAEEEVLRSEARLQEALANVQRSNKELEQFAYVASHDLQEPLRMVASYTQLLAERYEGQLDDKAKKYIDYAVGGAVRMQRLINDLLTYSRINTQGKAPEPVDSHTVLGRALADLHAAIEESRAIVTNDDLPTVRADAGQLAQVLQNLIANAIKFHGADPPRIHVSARDLGREWLFSVQDNGIGIEKEYADRVFVIFQRLHTRDEYPGTGIGLAVCKRIMDRHGGRIWFESEPGKGSTFFFTVPK